MASKNLPLPEPILDLVIFCETDKAKCWESRHYRRQVKTHSSMPKHTTSHNGFPAVRPGVPSLPPWRLLLLHFLPPCLLDCAQGLSFIRWLQFCSDLFSIHGNLKCEGRLGDDITHQVLLITHSSHHNSSEQRMLIKRYNEMCVSTSASPYSSRAGANPQRQTPPTIFFFFRQFLIYLFRNFLCINSYMKI